ARRMELEAIPGGRGDECPATPMLLDPQLAHVRAGQRLDELVLVEREAEMVYPGQLPLTRLDDDVHGAAFELRQPELEAHAVQVLPAVARLERGHLLADAAVTSDEIEAELAEVTGLDLPHLARDQVVVEQLHLVIRADRRGATSPVDRRRSRRHAGGARMASKGDAAESAPGRLEARGAESGRL